MSQNKVYTLLERLELNLNFAKDIMLKELCSLGVFDPNSNWKILDRAIGGGQLVHWCEDSFRKNKISPINRVYGCERRKATVKYAIITKNLEGKYTYTGGYTDEEGDLLKPKFDNISFLPGQRNFKYIEIGNYPYNDGSVNNTVIWNKFIADVKASQADAVGVIVQASFLSQEFKGMSKKVKNDLKALGCYKIIINDYDDFDTEKAKVKTCIVFCRKGYQGDVTYIERKTNISIIKPIDLPFDMVFEPNKRRLLDEINKVRTSSFKRFPKYDKFKKTNSNKWAIGCYYKTEGFDLNPLKSFIIIAPDSGKVKDHYVIFGHADTEKEAIDLKIKLESFWFSDIVQAILILTRYQISLDATQYSKVPYLNIDKVFTNEDLYNLWNISKESKIFIDNLTKDCLYRKISDDKDS